MGDAPAVLATLVEAPSGALAADCVVCGIDTYLRLPIGDGLAPVCSAECRRAFPRVEAARSAIAYAIRRVGNDPDFRYHMIGTETLDRFCRAHAALSGRTEEEVHEDVLRHGSARGVESYCARMKRERGELELQLEELRDGR